MATTAVLNWTAQSGAITQELFYGKDAVVTGLPGSGTGWSAYSGNPMGPLVSTATINGLDDNVKYRYLVRTNCASNQSTFAQVTGTKSVCTSLSIGTPDTGGVLQYTLTVPGTFSTAGSNITGVTVTARGTNSSTNTVFYAEKTYTPPFSSSYTDVFSRIDGTFTSWEMYTIMKSGVGADIPLFECGPRQQFNTVGTPKRLYLINGTSSSSITELFLPDLSAITSGIPNYNYVASPVTQGTTYKPFINTLSTSFTTVGVTMSGVISGSLMYIRVIRAGSVVYGSGFTYTGNNTQAIPTQIQIHFNDVIEILDGGKTGAVIRQEFAIKVISPDNGYDLAINLDLPQSSNMNFDITMRAFCYSSGAAESYTATVTVTAGQTLSNTVHITSSMSPADFATAVITTFCVVPASSTIVVPSYYVSC